MRVGRDHLCTPPPPRAHQLALLIALYLASHYDVVTPLAVMMFKLVQLYFAVSALGLAILYEFISSNSVLQIALAWEAGNNAPVSAPKRILVG